ncbi:DUF885 domain-containing protein [Sphingosinicella sp. LHD-64]|uniref:DUF885 domain-containing protein n=1 Tax=Sphingosinicella sp. LHD-64 TaxID=3072139 RepID=UPI00280E0A67|nr:DUF885 domain-containing protein [Sphingosinicella sp. LHD-64]MDQ8754977.1 DUF885 domain-containing protein [Sphingosinicella sp. LHD-64]
MITRREFGLLGGAFATQFWATPLFAIQSDEDARLNAFFDAIYQRGLDRSPIAQSRQGLKTNQDKWDDLSEARQLEGHALRQQDLARLREFDIARLSPQSRLSYRMFERGLEESLRDWRWRDHGYGMTQMGGMHTRVATTLINSHPIQSRGDADAYILRLERVGPLMGQVIANLEREEAAGIRPPRFVYPLVIGPCENLLRGAPFETGADSPMLADFKTKLNGSEVPASERAALVQRAESALRGGFATGYRNLLAYLRGAESRADDVDGVWKLPDGAAFYRTQLEGYTTLPLDPADVHALGLREVARIHEEMRAIMVRTGFTGSLQDFFEFMRTERRFYHPDTAEGRAAYLAEANVLLAEIRARQGELFGRLPTKEVEVRAVEAWRERSAPKASYTNPPQDGSRPGIFYVNLADMSAQPRYQLAAILYHEAIPGHHVETVVAHELTDLPRFRRFAGVAAFSEGWGLYSELLPKEMGLYADPYADFGRLSMSLMRACRLVVDTGIHAMRWTRTQATEYLDRNMPSSHADNVREIDRYIVLPGQACSYFIGMQKILELRQRARQRLGQRFDLRAFHDQVLGSGPLPLPMLEEQIDAWIAAA